MTSLQAAARLRMTPASLRPAGRIRATGPRPQNGTPIQLVEPVGLQRSPRRESGGSLLRPCPARSPSAPPVGGPAQSPLRRPPQIPALVVGVPQTVTHLVSEYRPSGRGNGGQGRPPASSSTPAALSWATCLIRPGSPTSQSTLKPGALRALGRCRIPQQGLVVVTRVGMGRELGNGPRMSPTPCAPRRAEGSLGGRAAPSAASVTCTDLAGADPLDRAGPVRRSGSRPQRRLAVTVQAPSQPRGSGREGSEVECLASTPFHIMKRPKQDQAWGGTRTAGCIASRSSYGSVVCSPYAAR